MRIDRLSKGNLANFDVDEINDILREMGSCETVTSLVDVSKYQKLDDHVIKLCRASDGTYLNIVYFPFTIPEDDLQLIIKDTEEIWKILNNEAIEKGENTDFVKTIIMQDFIFEEDDTEDSSDGIKFINDNYSISKHSMKNFSSLKEYDSIQDKMRKSTNLLSSDNFFANFVDSMSIDEINGLLKLLKIDDAIEELIDLDLEDCEHSIDTFIGRNKNGEYIIIAIISEFPDDLKIEEFKSIHEAIFNALIKKGVEKPILKNYVVNMG